MTQRRYDILYPFLVTGFSWHPKPPRPWPDWCDGLLGAEAPLIMDGASVSRCKNQECFNESSKQPGYHGKSLLGTYLTTSSSRNG